MEPKVIWVDKITDWPMVAQSILKHSEGRKKFVLQGEIGAGKTTLVQVFCHLLGIENSVTSPTFSIVNPYTTSSGTTVNHLDLYRLKNQQEALDIGIEDILYDESYCFIEWPEVIEDILPEDLVVIKITVEPNSKRKILFL
ncbi:MAG: tRNA (adenosine(37)-N6)-threonylcarbamoyltransferase complex ATPase subunit type 1 TsaE [Bacteroidota bacterium]